MTKMRNCKSLGLGVLIALGLLAAGCAGEDGDPGPAGLQGPVGSSAAIVVPDDRPEIQEAVDALPTAGGRVFVRAGTYLLSRGVHVARSNVEISGEPGTVLRLGAGANQPVLLLGSDAQTPTTQVQNVRISNLEIDGNQTAQSSETDPSRPWIRNNGIDVRAVEGLWIDGVNVHDARSGGLVVSWNSKTLFVSNSVFSSNRFDGIALYASEDILVDGFQCAKNGAAGLSLDNDLSQVQFSGGRIEGNGDVGIFARASKDVAFYDLVIAGNGSHGAFLSHQQLGNGTGVTRLFFAGCSFLDNSGYGLWLASPAADSPNNVVSSSLFSGNSGGAVKLDDGAALTQEGNVTQ